MGQKSQIISTFTCESCGKMETTTSEDIKHMEYPADWMYLRMNSLSKNVPLHMYMICDDCTKSIANFIEDKPTDGDEEQGDE